MAAHAMLYCLDIDALDFNQIALAAGVPSVTPERDPETGGTRIAVKLGETTAVLFAVPKEVAERQLFEFSIYLKEECELTDPDLPSRLREVKAALQLDFEPEMDKAGECARYLRALAQCAKAFVYREEGTLEDPSGTVVARPRGEAPRVLLRSDAPFPEPKPPPAERVGRRALVVASLAWRSSVERHKPQNAEQLVADTHAWLDQHKLWDEMEPAEAALHRAASGSWAERDMTQASWGIEGAAVLAWALRLAELPAHDVQVDPAAIGRALGLLSPTPAALAAGLRLPTELDWMVRRLVGLHLRLHAFSHQPGREDFEKFARGCWRGGFDPAGIRLAQSDLALGEQPLWLASERALSAVLSIAMERHRAASWLAGMNQAWSEPVIPTRG